MHQTSVLRKEPSELPCPFYCVRAQQEGISKEPSDKTLLDTTSAVLDVSASRTVNT